MGANTVYKFDMPNDVEEMIAEVDKVADAIKEKD
jgi:hypothetical protein